MKHMHHPPITPHGKAPHGHDHSHHMEHVKKHAAGHKHHAEHVKEHAAGHMHHAEHVKKMCGGGYAKGK